jgi:hypothetical protein
MVYTSCCTTKYIVCLQHELSFHGLHCGMTVDSPEGNVEMLMRRFLCCPPKRRTSCGTRALLVIVVCVSCGLHISISRPSLCVSTVFSRGRSCIEIVCVRYCSTRLNDPLKISRVPEKGKCHVHQTGVGLSD